MTQKKLQRIGSVSCSTLLLVSGLAHAQAAAPADPSDTRLETLQAEVADRIQRLEAMKRSLTEQEAGLKALRRTLNNEMLSRQRGGTDPNGAPLPPDADTSAQAGPPSSPPASDQAGPQSPSPATAEASPVPEPVGKAPERQTTPPAAAQIFEQPGVLTPKGQFVLEPSFQFGYSSSNRVALVGYTIIPALLIGLIDVREVKTTTLTGAVALRYGITNRFEIEAKVPYVHTSSQTVSREVLTGTAVDNTFDASGSGLGDVEFTGRYQFNDGGPNIPYFIGWLRFKTRTGRDPFEVTTDCVTRCVANTTGTGLPLQLPTGSGFYALQPGVTWIYASDPAVFFGSFSYLHNFSRSDVSRTVLAGGQEFLGTIQPGDIFGFNVGMGLALNEKASFSIGYDQSIVGSTKQNGQTIPGSTRVVLGTLLVGYSYQLNKKTTMNFTIGAGLTRDTPDLTLTLRVPISF